LGRDQFLEVPDGVIGAGHGEVKACGRRRMRKTTFQGGIHYTLPGPQPSPLPRLSKTTLQHRRDSCLMQSIPRDQCLSAVSGYLHLTRTFFPRRSLQTTSIILAGATQGGEEEALGSTSGSPRSQKPQFPNLSGPRPSDLPLSLFISANRGIRVLSGPTSRVPGPGIPDSRVSAPSRPQGSRLPLPPARGPLVR
jgi:hypothetical protein